MPVVLEAARALAKGYECRVRLPDGSLDEAVITAEEAAALAGAAAPVESKATTVNAEQLRLLVESARIRLAYAHDKHFAVSLSGIRTLPHQIEAVYIKMLPQPRLRFLLADDPGAGKTIMAGLLIKEMKLREAIERILILCPSPLTIQWQDEMLRWFGESFDIIFSAVDQQQLTNPWQRSSQVVASLDYAKQDEVRERVWQQHWDLVIIDEAHKCSAYTKRSSSRGDEAEKTKRYQLAEKLTAEADHVVLLTATPHHGDDDRFAHFVRLLDPDLFPEPHRMADKAGEIRRDILRLGPDCPWALRRMKEDLKDLDGCRLFPDRHAHTITFRLNREEYDLYKAVTAYINDFLPQASGKKKQSVALARTVLQRRLASSTMAIFESIRRRLQKQQELLEELENLPPAQRAKRLAQLQGRLTDAEQEEDDLDDAERDLLADEFTSAVELDQLRSEIAALQELLARARRVKDLAADSKLTALRDCLKRAEFGELSDGRGKLLVFTEHRDTLKHLLEHLQKWGYTTCEIHGGMNPHERKRAQEDFRTARQVCVATEAAGEGINLQFCRLMVNYDLPWNPTRLEQRLGRIHRFGQKEVAQVYNLVAKDTVEERIYGLLAEKLHAVARAIGKTDRETGEPLEDFRLDILGFLGSNPNYQQLFKQALVDKDYRRTAQQIDEMMEQAQMARVALMQLSQDLTHFNLEHYKRITGRFNLHQLGAWCREAIVRLGGTLLPMGEFWQIQTPECLKAFTQVAPKYENVTFDRELAMRKKRCELMGIGHPLIDALIAYFQNAPFSGDTACLPANGAKPGCVEARYRVTWDCADQGSAAGIVRVAVNGQCYVDEGGFDAERLETGHYVAPQPPTALPLEAEARADEAIRLWTASRRTEMPEGTIVRYDLLGVSASV